MVKIILTISFAFTIYVGGAQVKIGYNSGSINSAALLELSNNLQDAPATWKSFLPPGVDFNNPVFTSNSVWGIAGVPTAGAIVFNIGENYANGFSGIGLYCWLRDSWSPINVLVTDKIRLALSTSKAAYDAATANSWVNVSAAEYNNLLVMVSGAAKYATPEIFMNTSVNGGWSANYTIGGSNNSAKVPASSYIIGWSVRTGSGVSSSLNSKLKVSVSQNTDYVDYGSPLPAIGNIAGNTRVYFVLKTPVSIIPATPCFTAVFNSSIYFLGNNSGGTAGPEYYVFGDNPNPNLSFQSDSYSQVISTSTRQW